jgi:5'(3')-deoxyribonucleotidase
MDVLYQDMKKLLIDMDGVLVDFVGGLCKVLNRPLDSIDYPLGVYDITKVFGMSEDEIWDRVNAFPNFWVDLEPYPWAKQILEIAETRFKNNWYIATSPSRSEQSASQKVLWMKKHIHPKFRRYMIGPNKYLMACPNKILLDDYDHNVNQFKEHGGDAILFPRLWNSLHHYHADPMDTIHELLHEDF